MAFLKRKGFGKFHARLPQKLSFPKRRALKSTHDDTAPDATNIIDAETTPPHQTAKSTFLRQDSATVITEIVPPNNEDSETRCEEQGAKEKHEEEEREERDTDRTCMDADSTGFTKALEQHGEATSALSEPDRKDLHIRPNPDESTAFAREGILNITRSQSCTLPRVSQASPYALRMSRSLPVTWTKAGAIMLADVPRESKAHSHEADAAAVPVDNAVAFDYLGKSTFDNLSFSWDAGLKQSCSSMTDSVFSHSFQLDFMPSYCRGTSGTTSTDATSLYLDLAQSLDDRLTEIAHHGMALVATVSQGLENVNVKSLYEAAVLYTNDELARVRHDLHESANMSARELAVGISIATGLRSDRIKSDNLIEFIVAKYLRAASDLASGFERNTKEMISCSRTRLIEHFKLLNEYIDRCNKIGNSMKKDAADLINSLTEKVVEEEGYEVFDTSLAHFPSKDLSIRESRPVGGSKVYLKTTENGDASVIGSNDPSPDYCQILERTSGKVVNDIASNISKAVEFGSEEVNKFKKMTDNTTMNYYRKASDIVGRINCSLREMVNQSAAEMNNHCESLKHYTRETRDEFIDRVTNTTVDEKGYEILMSTVADYSVDSFPTESRAVGGPKYYIKIRNGDARIVSFASDCR
ncbi:hypothetical protein ACHAW6_006794 [Cyclotella cf. meneghiniana]